MADNFDKFLPDWQIGTLTLSANSTAFAATDALLTFGSIQQGDFIISPDGRMLVIESITDDDNGVLSTPCPPEAAGTFQTRIRYQSDNSRYTGQTAALRRLLSGGNLFALAKLAGDTETVIRFLGNGAFDLVDPTEFGVKDPNGSLSALSELTNVANLTSLAALTSVENVEKLADLTLGNSQTIATSPTGELTQSPTAQRLIAAGSLAGITVLQLPSGYISFRLEITNLNFTDGSAPFFLQVSTDGGTTWLQGAADYLEQTLTGAGTSAVAEQLSAAACRLLLGSSLSNAQRAFMISDIDPGSVSQFPSFITRSKYLNSANAIRMATVASHRSASARVNAVRIFPGAGSIITGAYRLYGIL